MEGLFTPFGKMFAFFYLLCYNIINLSPLAKGGDIDESIFFHSHCRSGKCNFLLHL